MSDPTGGADMDPKQKQDSAQDETPNFDTGALIEETPAELHEDDE